jgi:PemK-like, MazF-like toxin of type II toxin-antitoxin system
MEKDFDNWNQKKIAIHEHAPRLFFDEREIWFCTLGTNIGFEQDGAGKLFSRPVLIFRKFNHEVFWGIPFTRTPKSGKYYFELEENPKSIAILSQIRLFDAKRLRYKKGILNEEKFANLVDAFLDIVTPAESGGGPKPLFSPDPPPAKAFADAGGEAEAVIDLSVEQEK